MAPSALVARLDGVRGDWTVVTDVVGDQTTLDAAAWIVNVADATAGAYPATAAAVAVTVQVPSRT